MSTRLRIESFQLGYTDTLYVSDCWKCGVVFGMPVALEKRRREDHGDIYCPNGHVGSFQGKTEAEKERERAQRAERDLGYMRSSRDAWRDQADAAERSRRAVKGHLTRLRNRIANGVCPVQSCQRSFANVHRHISSQHPEWAEQHPEALVVSS